MNSIPPIKSIVAGGNHSLFLDFEGNVWVVGSNHCGQLGVGSTSYQTTPCKVPASFPVKAIYAGYEHSMDPDDNIWVCGSNSYGELGTNSRTSCSTMVKNTILSDIKACSGGDYFTLFLDYYGQVWGAGRNVEYQLSNKINGGRPEVILNLESHDSKNILLQVARNQTEGLARVIKTEKLSTASLKAHLLDGSVPLGNWHSLWQQKAQELSEIDKIVKTYPDIVLEEENQIRQLEESIKNLRQSVSQRKVELTKANESIATVKFYTEFLQPLGEAEKEIMSAAEARWKLGATQMTTKDVALFLSFNNLGELVEIIKSHDTTGEDLILFSSTNAFSCLNINNLHLEKKLAFTCKLLQYDVFNETSIKETEVGRYMGAKNTSKLLKEYQFGFTEKQLLEKSFGIEQLIFFEVQELQKAFELDIRTAANCFKKLQIIKTNFEEYLVQYTRKK